MSASSYGWSPGPALDSAFGNPSGSGDRPAPVVASDGEPNQGTEWQVETGEVDRDRRSRDRPSLSSPTSAEAVRWHADHSDDGDNPDERSDDVPRDVTCAVPPDHADSLSRGPKEWRRMTLFSSQPPPGRALADDA